MRVCFVIITPGPDPYVVKSVPCGVLHLPRIPLLYSGRLSSKSEMGAVTTVIKHRRSSDENYFNSALTAVLKLCVP